MTAIALDFGAAALADMYAHAACDYPHECCGVLFGPPDDPATVTEAVAVPNIQDRLHAEDPALHPRDARTAYVMDPGVLLRVTRSAEGRGLVTRGFYHSHPDHGVYFSAEDRRLAAPEPWNEPLYPGAAYVVIGVTSEGVAAASQFVWDGGLDDYREVALPAPAVG